MVEQLRKVPPTRSSCPGVSWFVPDQVSLPVQNIEARLKVALPSDLGAALTDGVVLCHLANHVKPRSVPSIHVPSPAVVSVSDWTVPAGDNLLISASPPPQPKLTMAKCRRNVENFLEACRRIGVPQVTHLCALKQSVESKLTAEGTTI